MKIVVNAWRDTGHPEMGGSEILVDTLTAGLQARGHEVIVRCGRPLGVHSYPAVEGGGTYSQYGLVPWHQRRLFSDRDLVVDVINGMAHYSPLWSRRPAVGLVTHLHTEQWRLHFGPTLATVGRLQEQYLMPWAYRNSLIATLSPSTRDDLIALGVRPDHIRLLPGAASLPSVRVERSAEPMFVAVGRMVPQKRTDLLLDLWEQVRPQVGGRLVVVGDGPQLEALRARGGTGVEFTGRVSDERKARLMGEAWLLVHPAAWEGWGLVITEANLAGTPALGFDVPGVRDAIRHGTTGVIAQNRDDFVGRWVELARDAPRRELLAAASRTEAHRYSAEDQLDVLETTIVDAYAMASGGSAPQSTPAPHRASAAAPEPFPPPTTVMLSIVIPARDEEQRLPALLDELGRQVDSATTEVIVVDDGSVDATATVARDGLQSFPLGLVLSHEKNTGKGAALRTGVGVARGEAVVFMDADMATDLEALPQLVAALGEHHVAIGSRRLPGSAVHAGERHRQLMAVVYNLFVRSTTSVDYLDTQCGFKALRAPVARLLFHLSRSNRYGQDVELLDLAHRMGLSVAEIPVQWTAVPGSKVRVLQDPLTMVNEVLRHRFGLGSVPVVRGLTLRTSGHDARLFAKQVAAACRTSDGVIRDGDHVHVLMPGASTQSIEEVVGRLTTVGLAHPVQQWSVTDEQLQSWLGEHLLAQLGEIEG